MDEGLALNRKFFVSQLISGGVAGLFVDCILFPIDTIKTRLQSDRGFWRSGGFNNVYKGLAPCAAGSAPTAALFFTTYELCKKIISQFVPKEHDYLVHMSSAGIGEVVACLIRVPVELVKQRRQARTYKVESSFFKHLYDAYQFEGLRRGIYRGFGTTIIREIPFAFIQFPLWEYFKSKWLEQSGEPLTSSSSALCGAFAGGIAAAITTPLDVAKTKIMLAETADGHTGKVSTILKRIYHENGVRGLFSGIVPRVTWIFLGGGIFFGFYEFTRSFFIDDET